MTTRTGLSLLLAALAAGCSNARSGGGAADGGGTGTTPTSPGSSTDPSAPLPPAEVFPASCGRCHGNDDNIAPPRSVKGLTATTEIAVGAHQAHVKGGPFRRAVSCGECHVVPSSVDAPGHMTDGAADVTFGKLAGLRGAAPVWDRATATCSGVYCHGATLPGPRAAPIWTKVDGTQATCGSCHGVPPDASTGHPAVAGGLPACSGCHPATVKPDGTLDLAGGRHVDGNVDLSANACFACHGDAAAKSPAPPRSTKGETSTSARGVGAHQSHLRDSAIRQAIACSECHAVPSDLGHVNGRVDLAFGPLARAGGSTPAFDGTSCASTWCHGRPAMGGSNVTPIWTKVDGTQAACGTCHGLPPPATSGHPELASNALTGCANCHPATMKRDGTIDVAGGAHLNGHIEARELSCTTCHGDAGRDAAIAPAPPRGTNGETATTAIAVGAHQQHLGGGAVRAAIGCTECHAVPTSTGHATGRVELAFGPLATANGASPAWSRSTATCASTYCHGGTLQAGGRSELPVWTQVDGSQAACDACHGAPPPASTGHPPVSSDARGCSTCHPRTVKPDGTIDLASGAHVNGAVEIDGLTCTSCHGSPSARTAAPPRGTRGETDTTSIAVGAHQSHVNDGPLRQAMTCDACHVVPSTTLHSDGRVDLTFGALARTAGAAPAWDRPSATCSGTYCHGATLSAGGSNPRPVWTRVDGTQDACGTCHAVPPPAPHPPSSGLASCARCHPDTMNADGTVNVPGGRHVNGVVDVVALTCTSCHGDANRTSAPPAGTRGETATTARAVGAHQRHLAGGAVAGPVVCGDCHVVPNSTSHADGAVQVTFSARAGGASASWNGTTCTTACHGAALAGGSNTAPIWTKVDGTQAACGTCHGLPPPASTGHPASSGVTDCARCHGGTMNADGTIKVAGGLHVNGVVDTSNLTCSTCHGDANRASNPAAPPMGTHGETATTARAVGAHQQHLAASPLRAAVGCSECHAVPTSTSHANGTVTLAWGPLATAGGAQPAWNGTSCAGTYCHGAFRNGNASNAPVWTRVDGTQATCGTCHGLPPGGTHPANATCGNCHTGYTGAAVNAANHMNGAVDVTLTCTSCHGDPARAQNPAAPPTGTHGETATSARAVGAHQSHLDPGPVARAMACGDCHVVPTSTTHANGTVAVTFGALANTGTTSSWNGTTCATYCHGATLGGGTLTRPTWTTVNGTQARCGTCHGIAPSTGKHSKSEHRNCGDCHLGYTSSSVNTANHVNGVKDLGGPRIRSYNPATRSCSPSCHGSETW